MHTPSRTLRVAQNGGEPIPPVPTLHSLTALGVQPRRTQLMMIAGKPGSGKSDFALWWAASTGTSVLYFSADMAPRTAVTRLAARASGEKSEVIRNDPERFTGYVQDSNVTFCFDGSPSFDDMYAELEAYVEYWDAFPDIIVVDNLLNLSGVDEYTGALWGMKELHRMARETGASVWVLHHTQEIRGQTAQVPQGRVDISYKISQLPEIILTVAFDRNDWTFLVAPVKCRDGRDDENGTLRVTLTRDPERSLFYEHVRITVPVP